MTAPPFNPQPLDWTDESLDAPVPVVGAGELLNRREISVFAGDTGSCKSWLTSMGLAVAVTTGQPWLGREVVQGRVLVLDEENPTRIPRARCRALGLTAEHWPSLRYYSRAGISIGSPDTDGWITEQIDAFRPALIIVDGIMAATAIGEINSNDEAVALYRIIRPWAEQGDGAHVVLLHHERKSQEGGGRARSHLTMGARQLVGQADVHLTTKWLGREQETREDGTRRLRTDVELAFGKSRDDVPPDKEYAYVESVKDGPRLVKAVISQSDSPPTTLIEDAMKIRDGARSAGGEGIRPGNAAKLLDGDCEAGHRRYKAALEHAVAQGWVTQKPREPIFATDIDRHAQRTHSTAPAPANRRRRETPPL